MLHADTFHFDHRGIGVRHACGGNHAGGIPEQVEPERTGILVPHGAAAEMATAITELAAQPSRLKEMSHVASVSAAKKFSNERMADAYINWYPEIIASWRK